MTDRPSPSSDLAIEAVGVAKSYGDREVLCGLDLSVRTGEVLCLLGPNGAGKTTTIEILEGYRQASAGDIRVLGFDPARNPVELRERTGVVLQECGFPDHLRVGELIDAWRAYYSNPRSLKELLDIVELSGEETTLVRRLSGGQRRRLDFALALAGDPDLIFLDEPTTGFDPEARRRCWAAIENLRDVGTTILLTTHYLDEAERLADRVALLTGGAIYAVGTPRELACAAAAPTRISFASSSGSCAGQGRLPDGVDATRDGDRVTILTSDPSGCLAELLATHGRLDGLEVAPPRLEDTYLELVGANGHRA